MLSVEDRPIYFPPKKVGDDAENLVTREVEKYKRIRAANFELDVHTSLLQGIVVDDQQSMVGNFDENLREVIPQTVEEVMSPETPDMMKKKWTHH